MVGGIALYLFSTDDDRRLARGADERRDRNDWIATHCSTSHSFSIASTHFYAFYLLSHGVVKRRARRRPAAREAVGLSGDASSCSALFIAYQLYRYSFTHDIGLIVLSIFDLFVIALAWHEYRLLRAATFRPTEAPIEPRQCSA